VGGFLLFSLFLLEILRGYSPVKLSIAFVLAFWAPMLALHEVGHALVARLVGFKVTELVVGFGRELTRFHVSGIRVRICAAPLGGYVASSPSTVHYARLKSALVFAAGPGIELLFVLGCWLIWRDELVTRTSNIGLIAVQSACVAALIGALFNLLPFSTGGQVSDGMGIVASLLAPSEAFRSLLSSPYCTEAERALYREEYDKAEQAVTAGLARYPEDWRLKGLQAVCIAAQGDGPRALEMLESFGHPDDKPPAARVHLLLDAAWVVLLSNDHALLSEAQSACERAKVAVDNDVRTQLLLGRTLLERGRADAAYRELMHGYKLCKDTDEEGQLVAYLAIVCARIGNRDFAARFERELSRMRFGPSLRRRVEHELSAA
jgi:hypothetical protein